MGLGQAQLSIANRQTLGLGQLLGQDDLRIAKRQSLGVVQIRINRIKQVQMSLGQA